MSSDDYNDGKRDADINTLKENVRDLWIEVKQVRGWHNRAIGYVGAIATVLTLLVQWGLKQLGA